MRKLMYAVLAVPVVAALIVGFALFSTPTGLAASAIPQQPQSATLATEQEDDDNGGPDNVANDKENDENDSVSPELASQVKVTPSEASEIAAKYLSVESPAIQSVELENEDGSLHYSIGLTKDNHAYDVEVDAITGSVGTVEQDD